MISVRVITEEDNLGQLVAEINAAVWDDANEMCEYDADALLDYLRHQGTIFVACHEEGEGARILLGMASSRLEIKPYARERWLYIDEVDVCADQRRKGAGRAIMKKLLEIAEATECEEVWLGTEVDNLPANALYRSLDPDEIEQVVGYTYELDE